MSLISEILKRGLTVEEIKEKVKKERVEIAEDLIDRELMREKQKIIAYIGSNSREIEMVERLFSVISNQSVVDGKILVLEREYRSNGGKLKEGYISNLFHFGNLEENKYLMTYLFNRLKNIKNLILEGYNLDYFKQEEKGVMETITKAIDVSKPHSSQAFENWLKALKEENSRRREQEKKRKEQKKRRKQEIQELGENNVDKMILEMLGNVASAKEQAKRKPNDFIPGDEEF